MYNKKTIMLYSATFIVSISVFFMWFIEKTIFIMAFVAVFLGSMVGSTKGLKIERENPKISILLSSIIVIISIIAVYYMIFLEVFTGAIVGFFLAKIFKTLKDFWFK